ncbi:MAG TPA: DUF1501 domain-containing protein [Chthonomonadaceae bacterium]|nr:DUF1501 domain-containing protein [Chthonomonadaceae bacterium]
MNHNWMGDCENFHRRDFLRVGMLSVLGLSMSQYFALAEAAKKSAPAGKSPGTANSAILIWLGGGPSHIDTFDPKPEAPVEIRGNFKAVNTNVTGIQLSEHLQQTSRVMDKLCVVRSVTSPTAAHEIGTHYMLTGFLPLPGFAVPSYGAVASHLLGPRSALPPYISIQEPGSEMGAGFLGASLNPFCPGGDPANPNFRVRDLNPPSNMSQEKLDRRRALRDVVDNAFKQHEKGSDTARAVDSFYNRAYTLLSSTEARAAFDLKQEKDDLRDAYGRNNFGQSLLLSRRLVEAGVRFSTVSLGGWDNHNNIFHQLGDSHLPNFDKSFATFIKDMSDRGLLATTLVVVMGEFGRTPIVNRDAGRDHYSRVFSLLLAGGGIKGGMVVGASDAKGMEPAADPVKPEDLAATIYHALGIDYTQSIASPEGVRITLARGGNHIRKAFA